MTDVVVIPPAPYAINDGQTWTVGSPLPPPTAPPTGTQISFDDISATELQTITLQPVLPSVVLPPGLASNFTVSLPAAFTEFYFSGTPTTAGTYTFQYTVFTTDGEAAGSPFGPYTAIITCVASQTKILMADGSERFIHQIRRGDIVAGISDNDNSKKASLLAKYTV